MVSKDLLENPFSDIKPKENLKGSKESMTVWLNNSQNVVGQLGTRHLVVYT